MPAAFVSSNGIYVASGHPKEYSIFVGDLASKLSFFGNQSSFDRLNFLNARAPGLCSTRSQTFLGAMALFGQLLFSAYSEAF
jgi:hypothetical protein